MASVTYGKDIMASVIMAKVLWQMKLSHPFKQAPKCPSEINSSNYLFKQNI